MKKTLAALLAVLFWVLGPLGFEFVSDFGFRISDLGQVSAFAHASTGAPSEDLMETVRILSSFGDRSTGSEGCRKASDYIEKRLTALFEEAGAHLFTVPVIRDHGSTLSIPDRDMAFPIHPINGNAVSPETIPPEGLQGPLIYAGSGELIALNGKTVENAIVLMDMDSGKNWIHAANLGARALIYVDSGPTGKTLFQEKLELTPVRFPRFWIPASLAREMFGSFETAPEGRVSPMVRLNSRTIWEEVTGKNIYALIPGKDPDLEEELVIVEAFYDSTPLVFGKSPGADEALGIATLLSLAGVLKENPPERSVLLAATSGHAQTLAGMREMMWSVKARSRDLRDMKRELNKAVSRAQQMVDALKGASFQKKSDQATAPLLVEAISERIKTEVDHISHRLMRLRLEGSKDPAGQKIIQDLAAQRFSLRRLGWQTSYDDLTDEEAQILKGLVPEAIRDQQAVLAEGRKQLRMLRSATGFRSLAKAREIAAVVSLHLSSHGDGLGAFNEGWLYPLKAQINRVAAYRTLDEVLREAASQTGSAKGSSLFRDTLRPSRIRPWQSYFFDRPPLGGEVSALAGYHGVTLATVQDARPFWGTPFDSPETINPSFAAEQSDLVKTLVRAMARAPELHTGIYPRDGFSSVEGRANFLRHGELFADQPAPGTMLLSYQGLGRYYSMTDAMGRFIVKGVADKKHVLHKVIIEGYRFDPKTGEVVWAIDKKQTGKAAYRVKMDRSAMETDLVMFACTGTTLFNLLEPRSFRYMPKITLIDARHEADPMRYFVSRTDTWTSTLMSIYLEPGTRLKMTLSDNVLQRKLILTHATEERPTGTGYLIDRWPLISHTEMRVAADMWALLEPRIDNLEKHGIYNERIRRLHLEGTEALSQAKQALSQKRYDRYAEAAARSWALASRVYDHVEKTQKDVLFGVLFYIALFVPFAFCMERLLFSYTGIYRRIVAFLAILALLIAVIYHVHPAFQLAYSPMVVILAFFIIGLSLMVSLIVFFRFEEEMSRLQKRARNLMVTELSRWKAFTAAFLLGVSNLRRRRLRTALTCMTLIILTFTIMSFTSVKTIRHHARILYQQSTPYQGFLMKNAGWQDLPPEALGILENAFEEKGAVAPRVWLELEDRTRSTPVPVRRGDKTSLAQGLVGLSAREPQVTGLDRILVGGRWLREDDRHAVLLPERMAAALGIDPANPAGEKVLLWGVPFEVAGVFSGKLLQERTDLDGEPLTPVTFPSEISVEMTEVEVEALESGEDVAMFQSRYQHVSGDLTLIVPYGTLLSAGGKFKGVAVRLAPDTDTRAMARHLVDRFALTLFSGEPDGTFVYHASDALSYSGVPNIVIPLLISVFIVLNTMIGSVYERKREIGIYTSVGLAPSHVSFLFIAEALAFAVLSVVLGYLFAQTTAGIFAGTRLWSGITVNYSSLAGVAAMVLVILVVLVSAIYPSRVAAEIAIPDVNRSWKMPEARGNMLELTLPFLMKYGEHKSIGGYLYDFFQGHRDVSHGKFSSDGIRVAFVCPKSPGTVVGGDDCPGCAACHDPCILLKTRTWLAPFDFGIMQEVEVQFCQSEEEPGFLEIKVRLFRESGEDNAWQRINKGFLYEIRRQLLLWRSLEKKTQDDYERLLMSEWEKNWDGQ